ncbi:MAG: PDZ domain-containing protein [bacterium]
MLYGFALECVDCQPGRGVGVARARGGGDGVGAARGGGGAGGAGRGQLQVWSYSTYPRVSALAPGGAAEGAGIRVGDVLISIDGLSLLTDDGARRFASAVTGDQVHLSFERDSKVIDVPLVLGRITTARGGPVGTLDGYLSARFEGTEGTVNLEIWSDEPVIVTRDSTGAMILRTSTMVVKLRKEDASATGITGRGGRQGGARVGRGVGAGGGGRRGTPNP